MPTGYSERGLVNALVRTLESRPCALAAFLNLVQFNEHKDWANHEVAQARYFVEPGFAQFGSPDLIIRLTPYALIFVEAKVSDYRLSASPATHGMALDSQFNSSINGQLSLRYRLSRAIADYSSGSVVEPKPVHEAAQQSVGDPAMAPRKLASKTVLTKIVDHLRADGEFRTCAMTRMYFVALTSDLTNPLPDLDRDYRPPYFGDNAAWDRTGWASWNELLQNNCLGKFDSDVVWAPRRAPIEQLEPVLGNGGLDGTYAMPLAASLAELAREAGLEPEIRWAKASGSITSDGRVILKIFPGERGLRLGIAADLGIELPLDCGQRQRRIGNRVFAEADPEHLSRKENRDALRRYLSEIAGQGD